MSYGGGDWRRQGRRRKRRRVEAALLKGMVM
jgi:hypothetical protein